jgi:hypothetical protein
MVTADVERLAGRVVQEGHQFALPKLTLVQCAPPFVKREGGML